MPEMESGAGRGRSLEIVEVAVQLGHMRIMNRQLKTLQRYRSSKVPRAEKKNHENKTTLGKKIYKKKIQESLKLNVN